MKKSFVIAAAACVLASAAHGADAVVASPDGRVAIRIAADGAAFSDDTPSTFEVRAQMPQTQSTRGQALAMYVVYDSPLP